MQVFEMYYYNSTQFRYDMEAANWYGSANDSFFVAFNSKGRLWDCFLAHIIE